MDVDAVRRMAQQMSKAAEEVKKLETDLTHRLQEVDWHGPDADQFRGKWSSEMVPALQAITRSVEDLKGKAEKNLREQEATSSR